MKKFIFKLFIILFLSPIANSSEIKKIVEGDLNAKIKIIVYESLTCSHCANFHKDVYPELKNEFIDTGLASIEFRNFPLDMAAFNAAKIAHCKNDGNSEILHFLYANQSKWVKGKDLSEFNQNLRDLVKDQISAPGVKAGTPQAAVAKKVVSKAAQAQGATA